MWQVPLVVCLSHLVLAQDVDVIRNLPLNLPHTVQNEQMDLVSSFISNTGSVGVKDPDPGAPVPWDFLVANVLTPYFPISANVSEACRNESLVYQNALYVATKKTWAFNFLDSSSKFPAGLLTGHFKDWGVFDECIHAQGDDIKGKYCLVNMYIPTKKQALSLQWAICVPSACSGQDVAIHLNHTLFTDSPGRGIQSETCQTADEVDKYLTFFDYLVIIIIVTIIGLTLFETFVDYQCRQAEKEPLSQYLIAFSLISNVEKLSKVSTSKGQIRCLHGIRVLSMAWVIIGHRYSTQVSAVGNMMDVGEWFTQKSSYTIVNATLAVDSFFLMSGLLSIFMYFKTRDGGRPVNIIFMYIHRYLRLTPPVLMLLLVYATLGRYAGSGPLWPSQAKQIDMCHSYWWSYLTYTQTIFNRNKICLGHTWYLSADMQLFIIAPLVLVSMYDYKRYGWMVFSGLTAIFTLWPIYVAAADGYPSGVLKYIAKKGLGDIYFATLSRGSTYMMGIALGYILYKHKDVKVEKKHALIAWIVSIVTIVLVFWSQYVLNQSSYASDPWPAFDALYVIFYRIIWCFALSWIIFACHNGRGGVLNWFLSLPFFEMAGRLTYCMYLVHYPMIGVYTATAKLPTEFSNVNFLYLFGGDLLMVTLVGLAWTLLFEIPFGVLEDQLMKKTIKWKPNANAGVKNRSFEDAGQITQTKVDVEQ